MKILHVSTPSLNIGDGALNDVIRRRLAVVAEEPVEITVEDVSLRPRRLHPTDLEAFDLVVVGGGGAITAGPVAALSGTWLQADPDELAATRVPVAFVALGHNLFPGDPLQHRQALAGTIAASAERGTPLSVRKDGSLDRLRATFGDDVPVVEVPDPGYFLEVTGERPVEAGERPYAIVQVAGDRLGRRLEAGQPLARRLAAAPVARRAAPLVRRRLRAGFAAGVASYCRWLHEELGFDVLLAPHIPSDVAITAEVYAHLPHDLASGHGDRPFRTLGVPAGPNADRYFSAYAHADLVVGMRGHSAICAVGLDRPFLALSSHPKVAGFMEAYGLGEWVVELGVDAPDALRPLTTELLSDGGRVRSRAARAEHGAGDLDRLDAVLRRAVSQVGGGSR